MILWRDEHMLNLSVHWCLIVLSNANVWTRTLAKYSVCSLDLEQEMFDQRTGGQDQETDQAFKTPVSTWQFLILKSTYTRLLTEVVFTNVINEINTETMLCSQFCYWEVHQQLRVGRLSILSFSTSSSCPFNPIHVGKLSRPAPLTQYQWGLCGWVYEAHIQMWVLYTQLKYGLCALWYWGLKVALQQFCIVPWKNILSSQWHRWFEV